MTFMEVFMTRSPKALSNPSLGLFAEGAFAFFLHKMPESFLHH
jgi:hypothetical protein